jgi:hypothetical protein
MCRSPQHYLTALMLSSILLLGGCSTVKYEQDFRPGTEFSQHQSFSWRNAGAEKDSQLTSADRIRLQRLAQAELEQRGYRHQPDNPDLLIDISAFTRISTGRGTGVGLSVGMPVGRSGAIGVGGTRSVDGRREEGVILVDITDNATNTLIWRGSATANHLRHFSLGPEDQLRGVLQRLLAQFPPK